MTDEQSSEGDMSRHRVQYVLDGTLAELLWDHKSVTTQDMRPSKLGLHKLWLLCCAISSSAHVRNVFSLSLGLGPLKTPRIR